jgi:hypothetical protein
MEGALASRRSHCSSTARVFVKIGDNKRSVFIEKFDERREEMFLFSSQMATYIVPFKGLYFLLLSMRQRIE